MNKLLVVVDMQNDFIEGSLGTTEAMYAANMAAEKIHNWEGDIFYTLDTHDEHYLNTSEGRYLPVKHCIEGTAGHELNFEILKALFYKENKAKGIRKHTFGSADLVDEIKYWVEMADEGIEELEVQFIGLCTDICVITNALLVKTFIPELKVTVDAICCAGVTPEKHEAALEVMKSCQIEVLE